MFAWVWQIQNKRFGAVVEERRRSFSVNITFYKVSGVVLINHRKKNLRSISSFPVAPGCPNAPIPLFLDSTRASLKLPRRDFIQPLTWAKVTSALLLLAECRFGNNASFPGEIYVEFFRFSFYLVKSFSRNFDILLTMSRYIPISKI